MEIVITQNSTGYLATFIGGDMDGVTVPTPHTTACPYETVLTDIQRCNPGANVHLGRPAPESGLPDADYEQWQD